MSESRMTSEVDFSAKPISFPFGSGGEMAIQKITGLELNSKLDGHHYVTYAELGFTPLKLYSESFSVEQSLLESFVERVNQQDQVGTLHPAFPISCVPSRCVRDSAGKRAFEKYLSSFLTMNNSVIGAKQIVIDLVTFELDSGLLKELERMDQTDVFISCERVFVVVE